MSRFEIKDDCLSASEVLLRARRVALLRKEAMRPKPIKSIFPDALCSQCGGYLVIDTNVKTIITQTAVYFGITVAAILSDGRSQRLLAPRHIAMHLAHKHTKHGFAELGRRFNRDHATLISACARIEKLIAASDKKTIEAIANIEAKLA